MSGWVLWLIAAVLLGIVEVTTLTLVAGFLAGGALAAAIAALAGGPAAVQIAAFAVVSVALIGVVRPVVRSHLQPAIGAQTGVAALIGARAVVLETVDEHHGQVKLGGEVWTARSYDPSMTIEIGASVDVFEIKGATAMVYPADT